MQVGSWTKLLTIILVLVSVSVLGYVGVLPSEAVSSIIAACLGYVFGNSHAVMETKHHKVGGLHE